MDNGSSLSLFPYNDKSSSNGKPIHLSGKDSKEQSAADSFFSFVREQIVSGKIVKGTFPWSQSSSNIDNEPIDRGTEPSILPCRSRILRDDMLPIESGRATKELPAATNSYKLVKEPMDSGIYCSLFPAIESCCKFCRDPISSGKVSKRFPCSHKPLMFLSLPMFRGRCFKRFPDNCSFSRDSKLPIASGSSAKLLPASDNSSRCTRSNTSSGTSSISHSDKSNLPVLSARPSLILISARCVASIRVKALMPFLLLF